MNRTVTILAFAGMIGSAAAGLTFANVKAQSNGEANTATAVTQDSTPPAATPPAIAPPSVDVEALAKPDAPLTPELIDRCLLIAEQIDPELARRLRATCDSDPEKFARMMAQSGRTLLGLAELQRRDPDLYEIKVGELRIEAQVGRVERMLEHAIRSGSDGEIASLQDDLRNLVKIQVALRIKARGDYLRRLQEHVEALKRELQHEGDHFEQTVDQRVAEITARARAAAKRQAAGQR